MPPWSLGEGRVGRHGQWEGGVGNKHTHLLADSPRLLLCSDADKSKKWACPTELHFQTPRF